MSSFSPLGVTYGDRLSAYLTNYEDFRKHRKRLNKSLLKLRHELNLVTKDTRNYQENEKTSLISAESYDADPRNALVLLLLAERDSVHSLEIKSLIEVSGEKMSSYKKLMVSKLKKAVATCRKMLTVVKNEQSAFSKLEFYVYGALACGVYAVHKKQWKLAIYALSIARCGLEVLSAQVQEEEHDSRFGRVLADELLSTLVDPSLYLALSQDSASESSTDLRTVSRKHAQDDTVEWLSPAVDLIESFDLGFFKDLSEEKIPKEITWRNHEARLYNDELAQKLYVLLQFDWKASTEPNDFDSLYSQWSDLVDIHDTDLAKNHDDDDAEKSQDGAVLLTYLKYNMLFCRIKRDLLLVDQLPAAPEGVVQVLNRNKDVLKLLSSIISTVDEIADLPGVYNDDELALALEQMSKLFTVKKSIVIANSYNALNRVPEALKVYLHAQECVSSFKEGFTVQEFPYGASSDADINELKSSVADRLAQTHTLAELQRVSEQTEYVSENIHQFPSSLDSIHKVADIDQPGKIEPVLCKPVLFDVAFNYIGYSDGVERTHGSSESDKKKGGFFGIFGRA